MQGNESIARRQVTASDVHPGDRIVDDSDPRGYVVTRNVRVYSDTTVIDTDGSGERIAVRCDAPLTVALAADDGPDKQRAPRRYRPRHAVGGAS